MVLDGISSCLEAWEVLLLGIRNVDHVITIPSNNAYLETRPTSTSTQPIIASSLPVSELYAPFGVLSGHAEAGDELSRYLVGYILSAGGI